MKLPSTCTLTSSTAPFYGFRTGSLAEAVCGWTWREQGRRTQCKGRDGST